MDEYQRYKLSGVVDNTTAEKVVSLLVDAGYYQCEVEFSTSTLIIPISFAGYIDDIERILNEAGFEIVDF